MAAQIERNGSDERLSAPRELTLVAPPPSALIESAGLPSEDAIYVQMATTYDADGLHECRYSPRYHWHRDCTRRPQQKDQQENWRRTHARASGSAAGQSVTISEGQ